MKQAAGAWNEFVMHRMQKKSGGALWTQKEHFGFGKMRELSWLAEKLLASMCMKVYNIMLRVRLLIMRI
jgi:hypothetical protein